MAAPGGCNYISTFPPIRIQNSPSSSPRTKLAQIEAQVDSLSHCHVLAGVPDVEVHEDWQRGEGSHAQPGQHENVGQHDELREKDTQKKDIS